MFFKHFHGKNLILHRLPVLWAIIKQASILSVTSHFFSNSWPNFKDSAYFLKWISKLLKNQPKKIVFKFHCSISSITAEKLLYFLSVTSRDVTERDVTFNFCSITVIIIQPLHNPLGMNYCELIRPSTNKKNWLKI